MPIKDILTFNRMKQLTKSVDLIIDSLKDSKTVEINPQDKLIRKRGFKSSLIKVNDKGMPNKNCKVK